jgi:hypothetical protein
MGNTRIAAGEAIKELAQEGKDIIAVSADAFCVSELMPQTLLFSSLPEV